MTSPAPQSAVLLSTPPGLAAEDLRGLAAAAGFAVVDHALGSTPPVDFTPVVAILIEAGDRVDAAAAQTRRWRIELGDAHIPVAWVLASPSSELAVRGLEAGADVALARPLDPTHFAAHLRAAARLRTAFARQAVKAAEARLLGDQLQKAFRQLDRELEMARRIHRSFLPVALPRLGSARFAVCHRPRSRAVGNFYDVVRLDEEHVGFFLADVMGHGSSAGSLLGVFARQCVMAKEIVGDSYRLVPPDEVLSRVNRELLGLGLDEPPFVAMLFGQLNVRTGDLAFARAGLPPPVYLPAEGNPQTWSLPGPFLGVFDASYSLQRAQLGPGDRLLIGTDGTRPDPTSADALGEAARANRSIKDEAFVFAVAQELLSRIPQPEDFTLLQLEFLAG